MVHNAKLIRRRFGSQGVAVAAVLAGLLLLGGVIMLLV